MERHHQGSRRQQEDGLDGHEEEDGALSAFVCPMTMQVMRDPVVIETGHAFEREAIARWFSECRDLGRGPCCPITMREVHRADLRPVSAQGDVEQVLRTAAPGSGQ